MGNAVQSMPEIPAGAAPAPPVPWSLPLRIGWRFVCCWMILYILPDQGHVNLVGPIPLSSYLTKPYIQIWRALVPWVAVHLFHLSGPAVVYPAVNGSGDSTLDYVQHFCYAVIAAIATVIWSVLDRRRPDYRTFHSWLHVAVRYALAFTMFGYGFAKVIPTQFGPPTLVRLIEPLGDFSPMGLLWTFIGYSKAYTIFSGAAEVLGGALLLIRRTATLGAMASAVVLANIVALNFCYDVPVKLYSSSLLLMALFLMAGDLRRVFQALLTRIPAPRFEPRWVRIGVVVFQILFVGMFLYEDISGGWKYYSTAVLHPVRSPLYGLYDVEGGSAGWKRLILTTPTAASVRMLDDSARPYAAEYDTANHRLTLINQKDKQRQVFEYSQPDPDHVVLQGDALQVRLKKVDTQKFLLVNRGFHWINERPFNR